MSLGVLDQISKSWKSAMRRLRQCLLGGASEKVSVRFMRVLYPVLFRGSFLHVDGLISIRRAHTVAELGAAVPEGWTVSPYRVPWRLVARFERTDG